MSREELFAAHDRISQPMREELAQRSAGEKLYDDYLLAQLRKGKKFKIALRKANAKFPSEALNPGAGEMRDVEAHYRFMLGMEDLDADRRKIEQFDQEIAKIDVEIEGLLKQVSGPESNQQGPAVSP